MEKTPKKKKIKSAEICLEIPEGVNVEVDAFGKVIVSGKKGSLERQFRSKRVTIKKTDKNVVLVGKDEKKETRKMLGTIKAHIKNMIDGASKGYSYKLVVVYSHFPIRTSVKDGFLEIVNFFGEKYPRKAKILPGVKVEIKGREILVSGVSKENVGQTAANIENTTRTTKRDRRIFQDGIYVVEKAG